MNNKWKAVTAAALMTGGLAASAAPCWAQTPAPSASPVAPAPPPAPTYGSPINAQKVPDVQIVCVLIPGGPQMGQWAVSAVYPQKVDRAKAEGRARRLLGLTGWQSSPLEFENRALDRAEVNIPQDRPLPAVPVMSSVMFMTPDRVVDAAAGTIAVEPFIRAYRDLKRIHVTYIVPPQGFNFRGLREFHDANVDVVLSGGGNAFTYVVDVKNPQLDVLNLPREQAVETAPSVAVAPTRRGPSQTVVYVIASLLALGAGALAFLFLRR